MTQQEIDNLRVGDVYKYKYSNSTRVITKITQKPFSVYYEVLSGSVSPSWNSVRQLRRDCYVLISKAKPNKLSIKHNSLKLNFNL